MATKFTLGKEERLKSRKQMDQLFAEGKKISAGCFRVHFLIDETPGSSLQFGVGVSTKNFKKAVDRNKIKRLTKEAWRLQKNELKEKLLIAGRKMNVFLIYTDKTVLTYKEVAEAVAKVIAKLDKVISA